MENTYSHKKYDCESNEYGNNITKWMFSLNTNFEQQFMIISVEPHL